MITRIFFILYFLLNVIFLPSCTKGKGAVCNDGSTSNSTGSGTCSWHGGVDYYIDPDEISYPKTFFLIAIIVVGIIIWRKWKKE